VAFNINPMEVTLGGDIGWGGFKSSFSDRRRTVSVYPNHQQSRLDNTVIQNGAFLQS
jgi:hypothetical protein